MNRVRAIACAALVCAVLAVFPVTQALAIPRDVAVARGMVWANYKRIEVKTGKVVYGVPYSQKAWALESGDPVPTSTATPSTAGYRTDCSGFVSLCWNLRDSYGRPYSASTADFGAKGSTKFRQITKAELQPGDMMLASAVWGATSPHAILFTGWADAGHTTFWALEQTTTSSHDGTILRIRPYGQAYYRPYRYSGIEDDFVDCEERISGADRYATAAAAVDMAFPATTTPSVDTVVVASGENWPDALGGAALAGAVDGPMLLTAGKSLPAATAAELARLKPRRIFVLGGEKTVSAAVQTKLAAYAPVVTRLGGPDRFYTSALVARQAVAEAKVSTHTPPASRTVETAFLATGLNFPDALAASPLSAKTSRPILLTLKDTVPAPVATALRDMHIKNVVILGGPASVSPAVENSLKKAGYSVSRIAGPDRYTTAIAVANYGATLPGMSWKRLGVASGTAFADALSGGAAQGRGGSLLVLTLGNSLDPGVAATVAAHRADIGRARVFGGIVTITQKTRAALATVLRTTQ
jgi:putative cell wall-binding protein